MGDDTNSTFREHYENIEGTLRNSEGTLREL
jgi:hypothetical protein